MIENGKIENPAQLEFAIFCIENISIKLKKHAEEVYDLLTNKSNILNSYIIPNYEVLHTQSKEYIIEDILSYIRETGITL